MKLKLSKNIKMVISDFDGVFTDGSIYISEKRESATISIATMATRVKVAAMAMRLTSDLFDSSERRISHRAITASSGALHSTTTNAIDTVRKFL